MPVTPGENVAAGHLHPLPGEVVDPSPALLITSLRSIGYSPETAVADIIDNSITAGATTVSLAFEWHDGHPTLSILDNGRGMSLSQLLEALRLGSAPASGSRHPDDLGRFGLGLKTASFSQCRRLLVATRLTGHEMHLREWDLDHVANTGRWQLLVPSPQAGRDDQLRNMPHGTLVRWELLDRFTGTAGTETHFWTVAERISRHLSLVFHRYLSGDGPAPLKIVVDGHALRPTDPFLSGNPKTRHYDPEYPPHDRSLSVRPCILPRVEDLTSDREREEATGPLGWEAHQGFFVYRNDRLLQAGGWLGLFRPSPAYNRVRLRLDLTTSTDDAWQVDVLKCRATAPAGVRPFLRTLAERTCALATRKRPNAPQTAPRVAGVIHFEPVWLSQPDNPRQPFALNRRHPVQASLLQASDPAATPALAEIALRLLEDTMPALTTPQAAELAPETGFLPAYEQQIANDIMALVRVLAGAGQTTGQMQNFLLSAEPYNEFPTLITAALSHV